MNLNFCNSVHIYRCASFQFCSTYKNMLFEKITCLNLPLGWAIYFAEIEVACCSPTRESFVIISSSFLFLRAIYSNLLLRPFFRRVLQRLREAPLDTSCHRFIYISLIFLNSISDLSCHAKWLHQYPLEQPTSTCKYLAI